jgi:hypothetical protein
MSFTAPKGWTRDSDKLYIHATGVRVQLMAYRQKEGWYLVPTDLDQAVVEFEPTNEGRTKAFEAFAAGVLNVKPKPKKKSATERKPRKPKETEKPAESEEDADMDDDEGD